MSLNIITVRMNDQQLRVQKLLEAVENKTASKVECETLLKMLRDDEDYSMLHALDQFHQVAHTQDMPYNAAYWEQSLLDILNVDKAAATGQELIPKPTNKLLWFKLTAAAAVFFVVAFYLYQNFAEKQPSVHNETAHQKYDILPGKAGAILTLADGSKLLLDSMSDGVLSEQSNTSISLKDNALTYLPAGALGNHAQQNMYNTLATPKGRQFNITLADGTRVWLNAASSIRFPVVFNGTERKVEITGEAFLEVAPNSKQPFLVHLGDLATIRVLGTSFNVNAYNDENAIRTTLIDGAVLFDNHSYAVMLNPGDQAQMNNNRSDSVISVTNKVDLKQVTAWKEGAFVFNNADISEVMRQLARWYNVEVEYRGKVPVGTFSGKIGRNLSLADVLEGLQETNIKFNIINGNKVIVLP